MSELRPDLNTTLANLAKTFEQRGRVSRQKAAEAMEGMTANPTAEPYMEGRRYEARMATAAAERWEARAATAATGFLLCRAAEEYGDPEFMGEYGDVLQACQEASRVVYRAPVTDQAMRQSQSGAPGV